MASWIMAANGNLVTASDPLEECPSCSQEIFPEEIWDGQTFVTYDDRLFHQDCYVAWCLDNEQGRAV